MAWTQSFIDALSAPTITPLYRIRFWKPSANAVGEDVTIYSNKGALRIGTGGVRVQGTSVVPSRWAVSFGGFDVELIGDFRPYKDMLVKGTMAIVECSFLGLAPYQTIALGQLDQISGVRGVYAARFKDILSAYQSRIDSRYSTALEYNKLFFTSAKFELVTHTWSTSQTTLRIADASTFEKSNLNGTVYCVPSSGDPFYMRWSSSDTVANTLTLTTGQASHPSTASASNLAVNDKVYNAIRINGTPYSFLAKLVTSTGGGNNGPHDVLPANWSTGAPIPAAMYDQADAQATSAYLKPSSGNFYVWDYVVNAPLSEGMRSVLNQFANVGQWPVFRQDSFSWRGCTDPTGQVDTAPPVVSTIRDKDIIEIESHIMQDPSLAAVYGSTKLIYDVNGNSTSVSQNPVRTLPSQGQISRNMGTIYDPSGDEQKMAEGDLKRMQIWDMHHWSRLTLRLRLSFAVLVAGDVVQITSRYLCDLSTEADKTYSLRRGMVVSTEYNISGRFCVIVVAIPPILT